MEAYGAERVKTCVCFQVARMDAYGAERVQTCVCFQVARVASCPRTTHTGQPLPPRDSRVCPSAAGRTPPPSSLLPSPAARRFAARLAARFAARVAVRVAACLATSEWAPVSYTHLTLPTNREV